MQYLHDQRPMVIHRDLKPSNIFLDDAKRVRVADFGNARFLCDGEKALSGETGKKYYYYHTWGLQFGLVSHFRVVTKSEHSNT